MSGPAVILREIHRLRRFAQELQAKIEQGPRGLKAQQARVGRQEEALRQAQEELKQLKIKIREGESAHRGTLQQVAKHEKQQNEAASKKEYDAFQHEIDADRKKVQQLEDEILDAMAKVEDDTARLPELEKAVQQAKEEAARYEKEYEERRASLEGQLREARRQLAEVEATLPEPVKGPYQRLIKFKGEDALAEVVNRTCTACYTEITAQSYNDLVQGNFVLCKSCGRMLYLPSASEPGA